MKLCPSVVTDAEVVHMYRNLTEAIQACKVSDGVSALSMCKILEVLQTVLGFISLITLKFSSF